MKKQIVLAVVAGLVAAAIPIALAADVPWVFSGDTTRSPASSISAASSSAFASWTHESHTSAAPGISFSSFKPGTVMIFK